MKKNIFRLLVLTVIIGTLLALGSIKKASAEVSVGVNFNFGSPPEQVILVPGGVYFVPDRKVDIFFYDGFWWTPRRSFFGGVRWYRSNDFNGPWSVVILRVVPVPVYQVYRVKNYREVYGKDKKNYVPYGHWKNQSNSSDRRDFGRKVQNDQGHGRGRKH